MVYLSLRQTFPTSGCRDGSRAYTLKFFAATGLGMASPGRQRLDKLTQLCGKSGVDGVIILPGPNMRYLLDFTLEVFERPAFLLAGFGRTPAMIVPRLDRERVEEAVGRFCDVYSYGDETGPWKLVESLLSDFSGVVGIESKLPVGLYRMLQSRAPKLRFEEVDNIINQMRICKDSDEVARHVEAAGKLETAMLSTISEIKAGMKEKELMNLFFRLVHEMGVEKAYCFIQSGSNSANPHIEPTSKTIQQNEVLVFDASVCYRGYYADFTRTIVLGKPSEEQEKLFNIVLEAQQEAIEVVADGVPAENVDRAARKRIAQEGYAEYFIHRTGHGLGVEVHEAPDIVEGNKTPLHAGMIFTVEPGIYLPSKFGVRVEDNIVLVSSGYQNTTKLPKTLNLKDY